jgi:lysophospholipase L1-like esterase
VSPKPRRWRRLLGWILFNLVVSASLAEVVVRLVVSDQAFAPVANVYRKSAVPGVGYTLRPGFHGRAFGVDLDVNPSGFRGPPWTLAKPPGTFRIALVGDSHAFGFGVPFEESVGQVLAGRLRTPERPVEVLTFAASGYNALQEEALLAHEIWPFHPDLVLVLATSNDHDPAMLADSEGFVHWNGAVDDRYTAVRDQSLDAVAAPGWLMRHSRLVLFVRILLERHRLAVLAHERHPKSLTREDQNWMGPIPDGTIPVEYHECVQLPLQRMAADARAHHTPLALVTLASSDGYRRIYDQLRREDHVPFLELLSLFPEVRSWQELGDQFGLVWDGHLNALAHRRWAEGIDRFLRQEHLF